MKVLFAIWGGIGLLTNTFTLISLFLDTRTSGVGVGTSSYASAIALIWIGGMLFFGLGSLLYRAILRKRAILR
jgi:hypothetical protein